MRYEEAFAIGSAIEGIIKCSYTEVFDASGRKLFSLQNSNYSVKKEWSNDLPSLRHTSNDGLYLSQPQTVSLDLNWTSQKIFEAVVLAKEYRDEAMVPVRLYANVAQSLAQAVVFWKQRAEFHNRCGKNEPNAKPYWNQLVKEDLARADNKQKQVDAILSGATFYVKPKSLDWYPLNVGGLVDELAEKQAAYRQSQLLTAAAGVMAVVQQSK